MSHTIRVDNEVAALIAARQETAALDGRRLTASAALAELLAEAPYTDDIDYAALDLDVEIVADANLEPPSAVLETMLEATEPPPATCQGCGRTLARQPRPEGDIGAPDRWCARCGGNAPTAP